MWIFVPRPGNGSWMYKWIIPLSASYTYFQRFCPLFTFLLSFTYYFFVVTSKPPASVLPLVLFQAAFRKSLHGFHTDALKFIGPKLNSPSSPCLLLHPFNSVTFFGYPVWNFTALHPAPTPFCSWFLSSLSFITLQYTISLIYLVYNLSPLLKC